MTSAFWIIGFFTLLTLLITGIATSWIQRRRASYGLAERESFFRSTSDLILILDDSLIVREINRAARIKLHLKKGEGIGDKLEETALWPESFNDRHQAMKALQVALEGKTTLFTFKLLNRSGSAAEIEVRAYPMISPSTGRTEVICYGRDISVEFGTRQRMKRRTEVEDIITRMMEATFAEGDARKRVPGILEMSGDFLDARRGFLFQTDRNGNILWEHLWSAAGTPALVEGWTGMNVQEMMPFPIHQNIRILRNLPENGELSEPFRKAAADAGMGSIVLLTLSLRNGQIHGYSGFTFNELQPPEDGSAMILLKLFAATMTGLLSRVEDQTNIKLFRESVDAAGQGIALIGGGGNVIYANTTYKILTGLGPESITPVWEHYQSTYADKVRKLILPMVVSGEKWTGELQIKGIDGRIFDTIESFVPVDTIAGNSSYIINMITDISNRKKLESQLINARKEAEIANRAKSDYLANMSHEIRTPMNAVIGLAYLALQTDLDSRQQDYLSKINTAAKGLLNIINDILDLSKIEAGRLELELADFSLDEVLEGTVDMAAEAARNKGVRLLYRRPPELPDDWIGDRFRLGQVLLNLVGNAVKFTNEGHVTVSVNNDVPGHLRFIVEDTGIGMTEDQISRLFKPFQQAEASISRKFGGTGLGLTISRQIVELMNGAVSVSSVPGEGSRFEFTVAIKRKSHSRANRIEAIPGAAGTAFILSPDPLNREFHVNALNAIGFNTKVCKSVKEVLENPDFPELLILDLDDCCKDPKTTAFALSTGAPDDFILILSGSREEDELTLFAPSGVKSIVLPIPYGKSRLKNALNEVNARGFQSEKIQRSHSSSAVSARILLADDNAINRQIGIELLSSAGLDVDVATNGREAINLSEKNDYNLIFMDLHMPVMDGYEATEIIRENRPKTPIIAMTASTLNDVKTEILDAGFSGYIAKPIDPDRVIKFLSEELAVPEGLFRRTGRDRKHSLDTMAEIAGIDNSLALQQALGDVDRRDSLLKIFADEHIDDPDVIAKGPGKDSASMISLLHYLRGSSGQVGASSIMKESGRLEDSLRKGQTLSMESFKNLANELTHLLKAISAKPGPVDVDISLLDELEDLIRQSDETAGRILEDRISGNQDLSADPHVARIRTSLTRWNFDEALEAVDDWRVSIQNSAD